MIKHESKFGLTFRSWWRANRMKGVFETKDTRGAKALPFNAVEEHQVDSAIANKSKLGNLVRVQSGTVGTGDYIGIVKYPSYIVIKYPSFFSIIDIDVFCRERDTSDRKSLTEERAKEIAVISVNL